METSMKPSARRVAALYKKALFIPGDVSDDPDDGWNPGAIVPAEDEIEVGSQVPPARDSLGNELPEPKTASTNPAQWAEIFDSLRPGQPVWIAMTSVMGMSPKTNGKPHEWKVGRRSRSKKYGVESITLLPLDGTKPSKFAAYRLRKRGDRVSASHGDMGVFLKSIRA